jgi:hypothetical protein
MMPNGTCISYPLQEAYSMDNKSVYRLLKSFLVNTSGWTWIEPYDTMENGRGAFLAWTSHYNGQGKLSKHTAMAKARVKSLIYKNERSLSFEKVLEILQSHFLHWIRTRMKGTWNVRRWKSYFSVFRHWTWKWWHRSRKLHHSMQMIFQVLVTISQLRFHICMAECSWRIVST